MTLHLFLFNLARIKNYPALHVEIHSIYDHYWPVSDFM
jgi:hypothetical protein